jgi:hypothetical protein
MRQATPTRVDQENDVSLQGVSSKPSWMNRSYGYTALESDTLQPIPEHFRTGSWMNRFGGQSPPTEQDSSKLNNVEATHGNGAKPSNTLPQKPVLVASAVVPLTMGQFVARQIAIRSPALGAKAAGLSLVDGPIPIGELLALGLTAWTAYDIYQEWQKYQALHMSNTSGEADGKKKKKKKQTKQTGKEAASDVPSWAKGQKPREGESGNDFAERLLNEKYGKGNYKRGPNSEYNQLRKNGDRRRK